MSPHTLSSISSASRISSPIYKDISGNTEAVLYNTSDTGGAADELNKIVQCLAHDALPEALSLVTMPDNVEGALVSSVVALHYYCSWRDRLQQHADRGMELVFELSGAAAAQLVNRWN